MIYLFCAILIAIISLVFLEEYLGKYKAILYWGVCAFLIVFTGLKPVGLDADSMSYEELFFYADSNDPNLLVEPSFAFISSFCKTIVSDVHLLFFIYAAIAISIKFYAIKENSEYIFLPLVIYFGNYFILHDYTQVRVSVASAFFLLSIKPLTEGNRKKAAFFLLCALIFHYSSMVLFSILFLGNKTLSKLWKIALLAIIPIGIVMFLLKIDLITSIPIETVQKKVEMYRLLADNGTFEPLSLKSPFLWTKIAMMVYSIVFYDTIYEHCRILPILLKINGLSIFFFFAFSTIPVLGGRVHELFGIIEILLFPTILYTIRPLWSAKSIVCIIGIVEFIFTVFIWYLLDYKAFG